MGAAALVQKCISYEVYKAVMLPQLHNPKILLRAIHQSKFGASHCTKSLSREVPGYMMNTFTLVTTA